MAIDYQKQNRYNPTWYDLTTRLLRKLKVWVWNKTVSLTPSFRHRVSPTTTPPGWPPSHTHKLRCLPGEPGPSIETGFSPHLPPFPFSVNTHTLFCQRTGLDGSAAYQVDTKQSTGEQVLLAYGCLNRTEMNVSLHRSGGVSVGREAGRPAHFRHLVTHRVYIKWAVSYGEIWETGQQYFRCFNQLQIEYQHIIHSRNWVMICVKDSHYRKSSDGTLERYSYSCANASR